MYGVRYGRVAMGTGMLQMLGMKDIAGFRMSSEMMMDCRSIEVIVGCDDNESVRWKGLWIEKQEKGN